MKIDRDSLIRGSKIFVFGFCFVPFLASLIMLVFMLGGMGWFEPVYILTIIIVVYIVAAYLGSSYAVKGPLPESFIGRYLPVSLPLMITTVCWAVAMAVSGGFYGNDAFLVYSAIHISFTPVWLMILLMGMYEFLLYIPLTYNILFIVLFFIKERKLKNNQNISKKYVGVFFSVIILSILVTVGVKITRMQTILPPNYGQPYGDGYSSVDIYRYDVENKDNILPKLKQNSTFIISDEKLMPVLDGAEAAYPVYASFANACYEDIAKDSSTEYDKKFEKTVAMEKITFTNTIYGFERLLSGDVDIFFGAEPSKAQKEMAEKDGKKLIMTPIGKEAFVFFVSKSNAVDDLPIDKIKSIYTGDIKNWQSISGNNDKIYAFQRPENSGSQTIMQKIMGDTPLAKPLEEEYVSSMSGISKRVSDYRNYPGAIGYSFRFFMSGMAGDIDEVKLIDINGVSPSKENIASNTYPYVVNLYAITLEDNKLQTIEPFLNWMQGSQGQELVEAVGYVTYK